MFDYSPNGPWSYIAGAALAAGTLVKLDSTTLQVVNTGAGDRPIGFVKEAAASGARCEVWPCTRGAQAMIICSGTPAIGDYIKCGASGVYVVEASAGTQTVNTIGQQALAAGVDTKLGSVVFC